MLCIEYLFSISYRKNQNILELICPNDNGWRFVVSNLTIGGANKTGAYSKFATKLKFIF